MKEFNDALSNMTKEELEMAIREQDSITLNTLVEATQKQHEMSLAQDRLMEALQETIVQIAEVVNHNKKETDTKLKVLAKSLDRIEKQLGNRPEGKAEDDE